jgi:hypothetical protein
MIHSSGRQSQIAFAHYVISIEDLPGTISADLHGHSLRYSSSDHVANCSSPQIMKESLRRPSLETNFFPCTSKVAHRVSVLSRKHPVDLSFPDQKFRPEVGALNRS